MAPNWFIALPVPADPWFDSRFDPPSPAFRRFQPQDLHLTVAFLGAVEETAARSAFDWITTTLDRGPRRPWQPPLQVTLGPLVPLGNPQRYSALSLLLNQGQEAAIALIDQLQNPARSIAGLPPETRSPKPHVTVLRPKRRATEADRTQGLAWAETLNHSPHPTAPLASFVLTLDQIALYTWHEVRDDKLFKIVSNHTL